MSFFPNLSFMSTLVVLGCQWALVRWEWWQRFRAAAKTSRDSSDPHSNATSPCQWGLGQEEVTEQKRCWRTGRGKVNNEKRKGANRREMKDSERSRGKTVSKEEEARSEWSLLTLFRSSYQCRASKLSRGCRSSCSRSLHEHSNRNQESLQQTQRTRVLNRKRKKKEERGRERRSGRKVKVEGVLSFIQRMTNDK